ncbi:MAG: carboxypeptidase-like regulatory domain-containing protein [Clostridiaceae bacterium]|nr:carboxypeptidase-like regulatory domain-containing protein [Clostridiaceae bacterium]
MKKKSFTVNYGTIIFVFFLIAFLASAITQKQSCSAKSNQKNGVTDTSVLPNASFKVKGCINPCSFQITLHSSRIILKKEIKKSALVLYPKQKKKKKLIASFSCLSSNGKNITYTIKPAHQKKLCPGNSSMDGTYQISSDFFSVVLSTSYQERIAKNRLTGFVTTIDNTPVKNALVTLKTASSNLHCKTDKNGYYLFQNIKKPVSISVSKSGFQNQSPFSVKLSKKGEICENIILKPSNTESRFIYFHITDTDQNPIQNASIYLLPSSASNKTDSSSLTDSSDLANSSDLADSFEDCIDQSLLICSAQTDNDGKFLLQCGSNLTASPCSVITLDSQLQTGFSPSMLPSAESQETLPADTLNDTDTYSVYITKISTDYSTSKGYQPVKFNFSFSDLATDSVSLSVHMEACKPLSLNSLSLKWDSGTDPFSCSEIRFACYQKNNSISFYSETFSQSDFQTNTNENGEVMITIFSTSSLSLPDGIYYFKAFAQSNNGEQLAGSPVFSVTVKDSAAAPLTISLQDSFFARALVTAKYETDFPSNPLVTFSVFQIIEDQCFFISQKTTDSFQNSAFFTKKSDLLLSDLYPDIKYCIIPSSDFLKTEFSTAAAKEEILADSYPFLFSPSKEQLFQNETAAENASPLIQIPLTVSSENSGNASDGDTALSSDILVSASLSISYTAEKSLTKKLVRSSKNYPNSIIAVYNKKGLLLSATLCYPSGSGSLYSSSKSTVTDLLTNGKILQTTQKSYQS